MHNAQCAMHNAIDYESGGYEVRTVILPGDELPQNISGPGPGPGPLIFGPDDWTWSHYRSFLVPMIGPGPAFILLLISVL